MSVRNGRVGSRKLGSDITFENAGFPVITTDLVSKRPPAAVSDHGGVDTGHC